LENQDRESRPGIREGVEAANGRYQVFLLKSSPSL